MVKKSKWGTTVALAIEGFHAQKIAKVIGVDKATMSRMLRVLTDLGYFICENPRDKVKFYMPTEKKYSSDDDIVLSTMLQEKRRGINHTGCFIDCHAQAYTVRISSMGKEVRWDNEWGTRGCSHHIFWKTLTGVGPVGFHRITGEFTDTLKLSFSHIKWNVHCGSPERYLSNIARKAFGWFEDEYDARLSNMRKCTGDHYSIPVRDPRLVEVAQQKVITYGGVFQLDASPPEKVPHVESLRGFDPLRRALVYPDRVDALEKRVDRLESEMAEMRQELRDFMSEMRRDLLPFQRLECTQTPMTPDDHVMILYLYQGDRIEKTLFRYAGRKPFYPLTRIFLPRLKRVILDPFNRDVLDFHRRIPLYPLKLRQIHIIPPDDSSALT